MMTDSALLGDQFAAPSWDRWKAVSKAAWGERLTTRENRLFREVAGGREPPSGEVDELEAVVSRRGGKTATAALYASTAAANGSFYRGYLRPGEKATILLVAVDRPQARLLHRYIAANLTGNTLLRNLVLRQTADSIELTNDVEIIVATNSYRQTRGRTIALAILDEAAFYRDETSANPDEELVRAIRPGLATLRGKLIVISSPYTRSGLVYRRWRESFGKNDDRVLVVQGATRQFNETVSQEIIDRAFEEDPAAAAAEWGGQFRTDLEAFVSREVVDAAVMAGRHEVPPSAGTFFAGCDAAGGSGSDSMTLAVASPAGEGGAVLCCVREVKPPFSPESVVAEFAAVLRSYGIKTIVADRYAGDWPRDRFAVHGITVQPAAKPKSDVYHELLPLLNSGRIELLDHPRLVTQLASLERRTGRGGRDVIDHPARANDDVINAAALALVGAATRPPQRDLNFLAGVEFVFYGPTPDPFASSYNLTTRGTW
jgi:hypothetical protein